MPNAYAIIGALKPAALKVVRLPNPALAASALREHCLETINLRSAQLPAAVRGRDV
jgi:hypothetical protein